MCFAFLSTMLPSMSTSSKCNFPKSKDLKAVTVTLIMCGDLERQVLFGRYEVYTFYPFAYSYQEKANNT